MGLLDLFRRPQDSQPPEHVAELYRRVGKLDATVASLELVWSNYRDELRRLVQRLEKRDQRAQDAPRPTNGEGAEGDTPPPQDLITAAIHARRRSRRTHVS